MIEETLELWEDAKIRNCCGFWDTGKHTSVAALLAAFASPEAIGRVLKALPPPAATLLVLLLENDGPLTRGQLGGRHSLSEQDLQFAIDALQERGILFLYKNRMKLDNGMDRLELNELIQYTLIESRIYLGRPVFSPDSLTLDRDCRVDPASRFSLYSGILPIFPDTECENCQEGLVFDGSLFCLGRRLPPVEEEADVMNRESGTTLLGVLGLSALLAAFRKKLYPVTSEGILRGRDLSTLVSATGYPAPLLEDAFLWSVSCSLITRHHDGVRLTEEGEFFLRSDVQERAACLDREPKEPTLNGEESIGQLFKKWLRKRKTADDLPVTDVFQFLDSFSASIRRRWLAGGISLVNHHERVTAARSVMRDAAYKTVPASLLVTGGSEVHVLDARISPLQDLYLRAFGVVEGEGVVRTVTFTEASVRRGLLLRFSGTAFLEMIRDSCDREPPEGFLFSLEEWVASFEKIEAEAALILKVSDTARELFLHDRELAALYIGSLDNGTIAVNAGSKEKLFALLEKRHILLDFIRNENAE